MPSSEEIFRPGSEEIFRTEHGSRLYGLAHAGSDEDVFLVTASKAPGAHHVVADVDVSWRGLDTFLAHATSGSHQSVEAAFSPYKQFTAFGERYRPLIEGLRVCGGEVFAKYERTLKKFSFGDFKRRRHAVRLSWSLQGLRARGRFNPVLTPAEAAEATRLAERYAGAELVELLLQAPRS